MKISKTIQKKLTRMYELNCILNKDEVAAEELRSEYIELQQKMVPLFLPILQMLVLAGLIALDIDVNRDDDTIITSGSAEGPVRMRSITADEPTQVFVDGNIVISGDCSGGIQMKRWKEEECANLDCTCHPTSDDQLEQLASAVSPAGFN